MKEYSVTAFSHAFCYNYFMKQQLLEVLQKAVSDLGIEASTVTLDFPENPEHGDFTSNVAMVNAKKLALSPRVLAEKIVAEFGKAKSLSPIDADIKSVSIAGPGFINFTLSAAAITQNTQEILMAKPISNIGQGRKVLVEYSSPNIAKPFAVGHLRSTVIGDSIARTLSVLGYAVIRDNHLGDWGTQFGKLLVAIDKWGNWDDIKKSTRPIKDLVDLYVKFHDEVERLENSEDETLKLAAIELIESARGRFQVLESGKDQKTIDAWKICIELSNKEFAAIYDRLGVSFDPNRGDTQIGESFFVAPDKIAPVMEALNGKKLLKKSEGAEVVFFGSEDPKEWTYPPLIIEKSDGTSIYATRDLAADLYRLKMYGTADRNDGGGASRKHLTIINEVGAEQTLYFRQLIETEKMLGWFADGERIHIAHGLYRFKDGKMSTRKGNVIWLEDILDEAVARASKINTESANDVAVAAIKFNDLKRDSIQDIVFDWDEMMNMTGDSGPYLQYSCVRAKSVIEKAKGLGVVANLNAVRPEILQLDLLEKYLLRFPHIVEFAGASYKPSIIANYLINLASHFNSFYSQVTIITMPGENSSVVSEADRAADAYKVAVTQAFSMVMESGLDLLGIKVPKKM